MKKVSISILIGVFVMSSLISLSIAASYKYVGSSKSDKYHHPTCEWALKINPQNLVTFESAKEALGAGYKPCKVCNPPTKDQGS